MAYVSTETTRRVRSELKQRFPNLKFSVSKKDGTLRVRIMAGDLDFRDIWEDIPDNKQYWKRYGNPKPHFDGYVSINTYHPDDYNPKYTDLFKQIISIMKGTEWFDNSDPQIDYFSTAYYLKLSVGKWDKPYQYTGTPRMDDIFRRFRGEEFEAQLSEYLYKCDACGHITDVRFSDVYSDKYCREACARGRPEKCRGSCGKNGWDVEFTGVYHAGLSQRPSIDTKYGVNISCKDCGIGFYGDARWELYDELPDKSQAEELEAEMKMHPDWCSNCGMKDDGCINLGYGDWYCMNFLNNRETYDGRYDKFKGEDMNLLNTYFDEEVYRLSPDIYAEVYDRIDYNSKQLGNNPSHQDRLKQFQNRVRRMDENIYQRAMETAQMKIAKEEEDFEAEGEVECYDCQKSFDLSETKTWIDDERYCADCLDFQRKQALKDDEALQREEENERIARAIRRDRGDEYYAEGEDMTLKDSAKLGFGLGAGLLGFRVALFGASALVGGLLLNRKE